MKIKKSPNDVTSEMLETTFQNDFRPGANIKGDLACADWRFLLPNLKLDKVLWCGRKDLKSLAQLARNSNEIIVVAERTGRSPTDGSDHRLSNIREIEGLKPLRDAGILFDLVWLSSGFMKLDAASGLFSNVRTLLAPQGILYAEVTNLRCKRVLQKRLRSVLAMTSVSVRNYWLTPLSGKLRTAVPVHEDHISAFFFRSVLPGISIGTKLLSKIGSALAKTGLLRYIFPRQGYVLQSEAASKDTSNLPAYVTKAGNAQWQAQCRNVSCGLSARGRYNSNKVLLFMFSRKEQKLQSVVKIVRTPKYNFRLENEHRIVQFIHENAMLPPGAIPKIAFFGYENGHAMLGLQGVRGLPFRGMTQTSASCPLLQLAADLLLTLAKNSMTVRTAAAKEAGLALCRLLENFCVIYRPSSFEQRFLQDQIGTISSHIGNFPVVVQHGDPGIWNWMVRSDGGISLLDWESGELAGMPLWDLFYLLQTHFAWSLSQRRSNLILGEKRRKRFVIGYWQEMGKVVKRYSAELKISPALIPPLFYSCLIHRALKEASRLEADRVTEGRYFNLLKSTINNSHETILTAFLNQSNTRHQVADEWNEGSAYETADSTFK